jgi:hypothetical protein
MQLKLPMVENATSGCSGFVQALAEPTGKE